MNFENLEHRAVIKFLCKKGLSATETFKEMKEVLNDNAPSQSMVAKWHAEFKRGRQSITDDPRSGRPPFSHNPDTIHSITDMIQRDHCISIRNIANRVDLSIGTIHSIIHDQLGLKKFKAKWIPKMLSEDQMRIRVETSKRMFDLYMSNPEDFHARLVTGDETWIYYHDPLTVNEAAEWRHKDSPKPKVPRLGNPCPKSKSKVMLSIFWDSKGSLLLDYLPKNTTVTGAYYADLMTRLRDSIKTNRRGMLKKIPLLLHDNAPSHKSHIAQEAIRNCGFKQAEHPPYSPDLAPSDFYLFPIAKQALRGKSFDEDDALESCFEDWLDAQDKKFFHHGIEKLKDRWLKCIELKGNYVEN